MCDYIVPSYGLDILTLFIIEGNCVCCSSMGREICCKGCQKIDKIDDLLLL